NLGFLNTEKIWVASVKEQFDYCYQHNLAHVWAYLYTEWYCPEMWKLWAHAASPKINILRSTMAIESHWRVLKHDFFSNFNNAWLDLIIYIIVSKVIPRQADRLQLLHNGRCMPKWREEFRVEWKKLSNKIIINNLNRITLDLLMSKFSSKLIMQQESYPLLEIKEENAFSELPKNIYVAIQSLNVNIKTQELNVNNDDQEASSQAQEQEFADINENDIIGHKNIIDIDD
ncbi:25689_t:CDS:2, partial [Dentiscutata erythropus]